MRDSRGFTLVEGLVALLLVGLLLQGGWRVFSGFRLAAERVALGAQGLETVRSVGWILSEELGGGTEGRDWWGGSADSVGLRAYRGVAWVEGLEVSGVVRVCYRGTRSPNPEKDSILTLTEGGTWVPRALLARSRGPAGCAGEGEGWMEAWEMDEGGGEWILARVFEGGSYHFSRGALRYRVAGGARQPLTPEKLAWGAFQQSSGGLEWALALALVGGMGDSLPWRGPVR